MFPVNFEVVAAAGAGVTHYCRLTLVWDWKIAQKIQRSQTAHVFFIIWPEKVWMQVTCVLLTAAAALTCFLPQSDQFIPIGTISELCCLIDKAENVSAVTSKFFFGNCQFFSKLILLSVDVTLLLISSEIIEICQILSEEFEKTLVLGADSRPLRHWDKAPRHRAGGGEAGKAITRVSTRHPKLTLTQP